MKFPHCTLALVLAVIGWPADSVAQRDLSSILADPTRPQEHRDMDADRRPEQVLEFLGIGPGDRVADLLAGSGYWTRILVPLVGPEGRVYAGNNSFYMNFYEEQFDALLREPEFSRVVRIDGPVDEIDLPADASLDAVLMVLAYHDLFLTPEEDRAEMNRKVFAALAPGGVFGIVDHAAAEDSGTDAVESLHRIDQSVVVDEVQAAGFVLASEGDFLRNPDDDRTLSVFDPMIQGRTDRFVLRFERPR